MNYKSTKVAVLFAFGICTAVNAQTNDVTSPLHLLQPEYPTPYIIPQKENVKAVLDRVYTFLEANTASRVVNKRDNSEVKDFKKIDGNIAFDK